VDDETADVTVVTYGGTAPIVEEAMRELILQDELRFEYIILTQLWPLHAAPIVAAAHRTRHLVIVEESVATFGLSAALAAAVAKSPGPEVAVGSVGAAPIPIPCARHQESSTLPTARSIAEKIRSMMRTE
jgi:pyruvate/2-oxoglutarate/acetoin dehydrogenase E1 component